LKPIIAQANIAFNQEKGTLRGIRAKKPRESSLRSISTTNAPFSFVSVKITQASPVVRCGQAG
jgi:hypothetical protein